MIEHDMDFISRMCDPVIVMAEGSVLFEGKSEEVKKNDKVIESYLGKSTISKEKIMAFFEGIKMTAGYGDGPDIISSCNINANRGR